MRIACVLVSHFPWRLEVQRHPELRRAPLLIVQQEGSRSTVLDCSPGLTAVTPGTPLQEALSACKGAALLEADPTHYQASFEKLLDALEERSPVVEPDALGAAYVELDGLAEMYGGEARLIAALLGAVPAGLEPRVGVGPGRFPAHVAALQAAPSGATQASEDVAAFLAGVAVDRLPLPWKTLAQLRHFGLHTLGQVALVGIGPLQAQFGAEGTRMWELAHGHDPRPLLPREHEDLMAESLSFAAPTVDQVSVLTAAEILLGRLFGKPAMRGRFARVCTIAGQVLRGPAWQRRLTFREPVGDRDRALFVVRHALANHPPLGPLEDLSLTLSDLTGDAGRQAGMFSDLRQREHLRDAVQQLEAHYGGRPIVYNLREMEPWSRIPERRSVLIPYVR
jgi:DNA polymerase-4/protein ImuB